MGLTRKLASNIVRLFVAESFRHARGQVLGVVLEIVAFPLLFPPLAFRHGSICAGGNARRSG
jgi:hypothetical protein